MCTGKLLTPSLPLSLLSPPLPLSPSPPSSLPLPPAKGGGSEEPPTGQCLIWTFRAILCHAPFPSPAPPPFPHLPRPLFLTCPVPSPAPCSPAPSHATPPHMSRPLQRIGVYNQHAADQLELSESPVEYLQVGHTHSSRPHPLMSATPTETYTRK